MGKKKPNVPLDPAKPRPQRWNQSRHQWYYGMYRIVGVSALGIMAFRIDKMMGFRKGSLVYEKAVKLPTLADAKAWVEGTTVLEEQDG